MSQNEVRNLQEKLTCQDKEICDLEERLITYDEDIAKKDALQKEFDELQEWIKETEVRLQRMHDKQLNIIDHQFKKLETSELAETSLNADNLRLNDVNACLMKQLKTLQRNEQGLNADVKKMEAFNTNLENELRNVEVSIQIYKIF